MGEWFYYHCHKWIAESTPYSNKNKYADFMRKKINLPFKGLTAYRKERDCHDIKDNTCCRQRCAVQIHI
jgi:hypothetical protein